METGTQTDFVELSRFRPGSYPALLNDILTSPAEDPSLLSSSDDLQLPASATDWSPDQRFADLEARLFERQEKMSETLRSMTHALDILSKSVHVKLQAPTASLHTKPPHSQLRPALPQAYDGSRGSGKNFIHACQAYFRLRPDQFPDEQTKIQWAMTYMSRDRAQRWVTRIYDWEMLPANAGVNHFVDWDDFRASFRKEFFLLHAEAVATNILEGSAYFQGSRNIDDYLDEFRDLISESGYTSPKTVVVKFRRGLNMEIGDAVATMAVGRPDNLDPEAWFEAAVRIDQSRATNEAFRKAIQPVPPTSTLPPTSEELPETAEEQLTMPDVHFQPEENSEVLDIKGMLADEVRKLIRELSGTKTPKTSGKPQESNYKAVTEPIQ